MAGWAAAAQSPVDDGVRLFREGQFAAAEERLAGRTEPVAIAYHALALAATGRCEEARSQLEASFAAVESELRRLAGLALVRCDVSAGRFAGAVQTLEALRQQFPDAPDVLYENARLHVKGWNVAVEELFDKAPGSFRVNQLSAEIFEIQGAYAEAVAEYRQAIEKAPGTLNLHYRLGRALLLSSHEPETLAEARQAFEAELELNPRDAAAEYQIAQIVAVEGEAAEARRRLERAVELDPEFPEALTALGRARLEAGEAAEAVELFERATRLAPESEAAWYGLMLAYRNAGRREEALEAKKRLDALQALPEGEFTEFLRRIGEAPKP